MKPSFYGTENDVAAMTVRENSIQFVYAMISAPLEKVIGSLLALGFAIPSCPTEVKLAVVQVGRAVISNPHR